MNIHLMFNEKFSGKFIELIDEKYPENSNIVYLYGRRDYILEDGKNVRIIDDLNSQVDLSLLGDDKLFVHGFFDRALIKYIFKIKNKLKSDQLVFIAWGCDLYNSHFDLMDGKLHLRVRIYEFLKKCILKKSHLFMTFAAPDYDLMHEWYGANGQQFDCLYPSNVNVELLDKLYLEPKKDTTIRILLGNSATATNQHFEALDDLSKFKNEDIQIICPLSYGEMNYGKKVQEYGKKLFGDKFVPITNYMSPEEYSELLNSVDIAVFNHNRQQGTGNIEILSYLGKKLYIRSDIATWGHYVVRDDCKFFDAREIKNMSFEEFIEFNQEDIDFNRNYFKNIWDIYYVKSLWDKVMDA